MVYGPHHARSNLPPFLASFLRSARVVYAALGLKGLYHMLRSFHTLFVFECGYILFVQNKAQKQYLQLEPRAPKSC